jgi:hypothetical protein
VVFARCGKLEDDVRVVNREQKELWVRSPISASVGKPGVSDAANVSVAGGGPGEAWWLRRRRFQTSTNTRAHAHTQMVRKLNEAEKRSRTKGQFTRSSQMAAPRGKLCRPAITHTLSLTAARGWYKTWYFSAVSCCTIRGSLGTLCRCDERAHENCKDKQARSSGDSIVHCRLHASPVARQKSTSIRLQLYAPEIPSNHHANFFGIWTTWNRIIDARLGRARQAAHDIFLIFSTVCLPLLNMSSFLQSLKNALCCRLAIVLLPLFHGSDGLGGF